MLIISILAVNVNLKAQISGRVFKDFNANGIQDSTSVYYDTGRVGNIVNAYDNSGTLVGTATTGAHGLYTIPNLVGKFRVEFVMPFGFNDGYTAATRGPKRSRSQIAFVTAPDNDVNLGLNADSDYCQENPPVLGVCFSLGKGKPGENAMYSIPYDAEGRDQSQISMINSNTGFMGAVWGVAHQKSTHSVFTSAFMKRHSAFGDGGTGAIYVTTKANKPNLATTSLYINLKDFGIDTGADPHQVGKYEIDSIVGTKNPFDAVGKISLGDLDISDDYKYLYLTNLKDKKIYRIFIDNPHKPASEITAADITSWTIPNPCNLTKGTSRPFGIAVRQEKVYVGIVCDASISQDSTDLNGFIYEFLPDSQDDTWKLDLSFPLTYKKEVATYEQPASGWWHPWVSDFSPSALPKGIKLDKYIAMPMPIITDLQIDVEGQMIITMTDRFSHQMRLGGYDARGKHFNHFFDPRLAGDVLRANRCGTGTNRIWQLEDNALVCNQLRTAGIFNMQGPGGGEFYHGDEGYKGSNHFEVAMGSMAFLHGRREVMISVSEPFAYYSAGFSWLSNDDGRKKRSFELIPPEKGAFGKAAELGSMTTLCNIAPLELGGRIWIDDNANGIQDADDPGVPNLLVELLNDENKVVGVDTTNSDGEYFFTHINVVDTIGVGRIEVLGPQPNRQYTVRLPGAVVPQSQALVEIQGNEPKPQFLASQQQPLVGYIPTSKTFILDERTNQINSKGDVIGTDIVIEITSEGIGGTDHKFDIGFVLCKPKCIPFYVRKI